MNKKSILLIILCALILSPFIFAIGHGQSVTSPEQAVQGLLKKLNKREITKIELYYHPWSSITYSPIFLEDQLINNYRDFKVVAYRGSLVHGEFVRELKKALRKFKFNRIRPKDLDYRLGCIFYDNDETIRIFISKNEPAVSINGVAFDANPRIVYPFMSLLPMEAYQEMNWALIVEWLSDRSSPDSQKKSSAIEQKR